MDTSPGSITREHIDGGNAYPRRARPSAAKENLRLRSSKHSASSSVHKTPTLQKEQNIPQRHNPIQGSSYKNHSPAPPSPFKKLMSRRKSPPTGMRMSRSQVMSGTPSKHPGLRSSNSKMVQYGDSKVHQPSNSKYGNYTPSRVLNQRDQQKYSLYDSHHSSPSIPKPLPSLTTSNVIYKSREASPSSRGAYPLEHRNPPSRLTNQRSGS